MRSRRLALIATGLLLGGVLAGCRTSPTVAAYLDSGNITEAQLDQIMDELTDRTEKINAAAAAAAAGGQPGPATVNLPARPAVLNLLISERLCQQAAAAKELELIELPSDEIVTSDQVAAGYHVAPGTAFADHAAAQVTCTNALNTKLTDTVTLTDAEYREIYRRAQEANAIPNMSYEAAKNALSSNPELAAKLGQVFAQRSLLQDAAKAEHLAVNPRYAPMSLLLMTLTGSAEFPAIVLDIASDDVPVRDIS